MMGKSIRLHKDFGVNPTIPQCLYCGEDKNEVALLGAAYKGEAPMHMIIDRVPCDSYKEKIDSKEWIGFFSDCGHNGLMKRAVLLEVVDSEFAEQIKDAPVIRMEKCLKCMGMVAKE